MRRGGEGGISGCQRGRASEQHQAVPEGVAREPCSIHPPTPQRASDSRATWLDLRQNPPPFHAEKRGGRAGIGRTRGCMRSVQTRRGGGLRRRLRAKSEGHPREPPLDRRGPAAAPRRAWSSEAAGAAPTAPCLPPFRARALPLPPLPPPSRLRPACRPSPRHPRSSPSSTGASSRICRARPGRIRLGPGPDKSDSTLASVGGCVRG